MPERRTLVCFANSRKYRGRCVAGKEVVRRRPVQWIRPVSDRVDEELGKRHRCYADGRDPQLLDIIEMNLAPMDSCRHPYQTENHRVVPGFAWRKTGQWPWKRLSPFLDSPSRLWVTGESSANGLNDRVSRSDAGRFDRSLYLIEPESLLLVLGNEGDAFRKQKLRAEFRYAGTMFRLSVTDPKAEAIFAKRKVGAYPVSDAYLCVSLGEPHKDDFCYKLVAGVIAMRPY